MPSGSKPGERRGGRQKGTPNKKTALALAAQAELAAKLAAALPGAFEGDAHAFLMAIYKDPRLTVEDRIRAATAALPYEKPKLASVELTGDADRPLRQVIEIQWIDATEAIAIDAGAEQPGTTTTH